MGQRLLRMAQHAAPPAAGHRTVRPFQPRPAFCRAARREAMPLGYGLLELARLAGCFVTSFLGTPTGTVLARLVLSLPISWGWQNALNLPRDIVSGKTGPKVNLHCPFCSPPKPAVSVL